MAKKNRAFRKGDDKEKVELRPSEKYEQINLVIQKYSLKNMIKHLCKVAGVSRSGYYNFISLKYQTSKIKYEENEKLLADMILKAYKFKGRKKGARQIKMTLQGQFNVIYNLKRIRRIMKKFEIYCPIRKANPYRRMMKATREHTVLANSLNREFKQNIPGKVLLTDITYLSYGKGKRAYLSTIKDGSTNEILAYNLSKNIKMDLVITTLEKLRENKQIQLNKNSFIHSDQGCHYTSPIYQKLVKSLGIGQSMSRRGNCWDNAPKESFYGHFKDESYIKSCRTYKELLHEVDEYMDYYNNFRYQWGLKKMTPVQYRNHLPNSNCLF